MLTWRKVQKVQEMQEIKVMELKIKAEKYALTHLRLSFVSFINIIQSRLNFRARNTRPMKYRRLNITCSHSYQSFCLSNFDGNHENHLFY